MIKGVAIPVLSPFKFFPAQEITLSGVNFQNTDNTGQLSQSWKGVYPKCFNQPVPRYWNDFSPGIDFQVYHNDSFSDIVDIRAYIVDLNGNKVQTLSSDSFFTWYDASSVITQIRFYADKLIGVNDGYYRILIDEDGYELYYSEIIEIKDTFDDCYPLEYSNFENDFGLIFENETSETWKGKMLVPMRLFQPVNSDTRETYRDDNDILTTLRSTPKRVYQMESLPVPTWMAEKVKMIFSCSDIKLNKLTVNSEESPEIDLISESDLMSITGEIQLNNESTDYFPDEYFQQDKIDEVTELITSWNESGGAGIDWYYADFVGKFIQSAVFEDTGVGTLTSNTFSITTGEIYLVNFNFTSDINNIDLYINGVKQIDALTGKNVFIYTAVTTATVSIQLRTAAGVRENFSAACSMKKLA
jgi:hypothetical protein